MKMGQKIIVADDEKHITALISDFLSSAGYTVLTAYSGEQALEVFAANPDTALLILDIMMPELDGWQVCRKVRERSNVPILFLTARSDEFDQILSFESGADDYVTKPFSLAVLQKRVEALLKRSGAALKTEQSGLYIDRVSYTVFLNGKQLNLTLKEYELLDELYKNKGRVLTRDQLLNSVWGYDYIGDTRTVDSHIARLRSKLGDYANTHLKTVYGLGYKIEV